MSINTDPEVRLDRNADFTHPDLQELALAQKQLATATEDDHLVMATFNGSDLELIEGIVDGRSSAAHVIEVARSQIGYKEGPRNDTKYGRWYPMNHQPWCAIFVSWVAWKAGAADVIPKHAYTPTGAQWFKNRGQWHTSPQVGDIVYYKWANAPRICHVGIVEAVHSNGSITAIEGNQSDSVCRITRSRRFIVGFGRPKYGMTSNPDSPSGDRLAEDGELGPATVRALQARLGVKQDGWFRMLSAFIPDFGSNTTKALQSHLNSTGGNLAVDGRMGPATVRAVQQRLNDLGRRNGGQGLDADGQWGDKTTLALQKSLNRKDF